MSFRRNRFEETMCHGEISLFRFHLMNHQRWFDLSGFNVVTNLLNSLNAHQARRSHSMIFIPVRAGVSPLINR